MRILLVEDDEAICRASKNVLAHNGHEAKCVSRMDQCAAAVVDFDPQIVILDLGLPDVQGVETLEAMQGLVDHDLPIIVFSAEDQWREECLELGIDEFLLKGDFRPLDLPHAVQRACNRHKLTQALDRHDAASKGELSYPGPVNGVDPDEVADRNISLAAELKLVAAGG